jgi:hypothetical protein
MKKTLSILALSLTMVQGAWAQTPLTPNANKTVWTLASMPACDIVLQAEYYTDLLQDANNSTWITANDGKTASIWLGRTLQTGGWNTFAVPFDINTIPTGWTVKKLTGASNDGSTLTLTFSDETTKIEAGKPYLVKVTATAANPTFDDVTISSDTDPTEFTDVTFVPVINPTALTKNDKTKLFVTGGNKLTYPNTAGNINGFRAYFQLPSEQAARQFVLNFGEGDPTVVGEIQLSPVNSHLSTDNESWYDLNGRKYDSKPTKPGVYVHKGEKQVIE